MDTFQPKDTMNDETNNEGRLLVFQQYLWKTRLYLDSITYEEVQF